MKEWTSEATLDLYRLTKCVQRLQEEYKLNTPVIIKKAELTLIKEICNELYIDLLSKETE